MSNKATFNADFNIISVFKYFRIFTIQLFYTDNEFHIPTGVYLNIKVLIIGGTREVLKESSFSW